MYYQKSIQYQSAEPYVLAHLGGHLRAPAIVLLGRPLGDKAAQRAREIENLEIIGGSFRLLKGDPKLTELLESLNAKEKDLMAYGWELYGFTQHSSPSVGFLVP